ncbi:retrovirus-related Pol polyprotein from transposon 17.6 [Trichonephila clavipes]|nr:retrovirus-related Pol polyprotein from transposon 17.6 [Trichonephila clavipes]
MSTLDLKSGYHQVEVNPADQDKTAFVCPFGTFRYKRMPFGLRNAPATFQRLMDQFRNGLPNVNILVYLDDIVVLSETFEQHIEDLRMWYWARTRDKASHSPIPIPLGYRGHYALGAVLLQGESPTDEQPVECASRLLSSAEKNYSTTEREALAIVWALNKFRGYIEGAEITVASDHQPLKWLMNLTSPTGRLARARDGHFKYNLTI